MRTIWVAIGGGVGSVMRYWLGGLALARWPGASLPIGTIFVNVLGCLVIGVLAGVADARGVIGADLRAFLFTGILGGFTTFSAFALETVNLPRAAALMNVALSVLLGLLAAWLGRMLAMRMLA